MSAFKQYANEFTARVYAAHVDGKLPNAAANKFFAEARADYKAGKLTCPQYNNVYGFIATCEHQCAHPTMLSNAKEF
jgi:hypothetical protein